MWLCARTLEVHNCSRAILHEQQLDRSASSHWLLLPCKHTTTWYWFILSNIHSTITTTHTRRGGPGQWCKSSSWASTGGRKEENVFLPNMTFGADPSVPPPEQRLWLKNTFDHSQISSGCLCSDLFPTFPKHQADGGCIKFQAWPASADFSFTGMEAAEAPEQ